MTPRTEMRVVKVRSLMAPPLRKWWQATGAWGALADIAMQATMESDFEYEAREMERLVGKDVAERLKQHTMDVLLGVRRQQ